MNTVMFARQYDMKILESCDPFGKAKVGVRPLVELKQKT